MLSNGHVMMQMLMYVCHDVNAPLRVCHDVNVYLGACYDAMMRMFPLGVYHDTNALMQTQFIQKFFLFSKRGVHKRLKPKYSHNLIYYS